MKRRYLSILVILAVALALSLVASQALAIDDGELCNVIRCELSRAGISNSQIDSLIIQKIKENSKNRQEAYAFLRKWLQELQGYQFTHRQNGYFRKGYVDVPEDKP